MSESVAPAQEVGVLSNLSTRGEIVEDGEHLIGGFVLAGEGARRLLIRGLGPGLAEFIPIEELVTDPALAVFYGREKIAENDDWSFGTASVEIAELGNSLGAFPLSSGSLDADSLFLGT